MLINPLLNGKDIAQKLGWAIYCMGKRLNTGYFSEFCKEFYGMSFGPSSIKYRDPLMTQVYEGICRYMSDNGFKEAKDMTIDDLNKAISTPMSMFNGRTIQEEYDMMIEGKAKTALMKAHEAQKPIIVVGEMDKVEYKHIEDSTRYRTAEIQRHMNLPLNPLGAPEPETPERINLIYRQLTGGINTFDSYADGRSTMIFQTKDAAFVYCPNPAVPQKMHELEKEFLRERNLPEPQIGGRAGVLKAMAEYRGIEQPAVLQEFVGAQGKYREDALDAVGKIFDEYNQKGVPIYACSLDTCFNSLDGGLHNYPILMLPGDQITVKGINENNFASIGDHDAPIPEELTVVAVHDNEHGSIVITDAGVFTVGGIGRNLVDQFQRLEHSKFVEKAQEIEQDDTLTHGNR